MKAVEVARTPRGQVPWSFALLRAQKELESKLDQKRDFLTLRSVNRALKGDGRGRGGGDVEAELGKKRYEAEMAQPVVPPSLKLRETAFAVFDLHPLLVKTFLQKLDDGRGCKKQGGGCKFNREHRCDATTPKHWRSVRRTWPQP